MLKNQFKYFIKRSVIISENIPKLLSTFWPPLLPSGSPHRAIRAVTKSRNILFYIPVYIFRKFK